MKTKLLLLLFVFCFLVYLPLIFAEEPSPEQKTCAPSTSPSVNPFKLEKYRIVPGTLFRIETDKDIFRESDRVSLTLIYKTENYRKTKRIDIKKVHLKKEDNSLFIEATFPEFREINEIKTQSKWRGILLPYKGDIEICYKNKEEATAIFLLPVKIPHVKWAYIWGIVIVILSFVIISLLKPNPIKKQIGFDKGKDKSMEEWKKLSIWKKLFLYPLNLAITPLGTYSISRTQILVWTYVTIFGLIYVYWLTESFLDITSQVLMLLGIGGSTAIGSKINAISKTYEVPPKYLNLVERKRIPRLNDLISTEGRPSIFKFQMLVFTLLTAYMVVVEIAKNYAFPQIPENLIALMGISSAVYIGNEITQENVGEKIKKKIEEIEKYAKDNNKSFSTHTDIENLGSPEVEELRNILTSIYS